MIQCLDQKKLMKIFFKYFSEREITIFTHDSYWDMIACILSIFNKNNSYQNPLELVNQSKVIFIRLHPSLNKKDALKQLLNIREIPKNIKFNL